MADTKRTVPAAELRPGDQVTVVRTVTQVVHTAERVEVTFNDGAVQIFDLAGDPAVEVTANP